MNKPELVEKMAERTGLTKKDAELALKGFIDTVEDTVASGERVVLVGFGTFEPRKRAERAGRNPQTKEEITIPETVTPGFKAGKEFKDKVKNAK